MDVAASSPSTTKSSYCRRAGKPETGIAEVPTVFIACKIQVIEFILPYILFSESRGFAMKRISNGEEHEGAQRLSDVLLV